MEVVAKANHVTVSDHEMELEKEQFLLGVKQGLDVARGWGVAYVQGLGFIHRDIKSDNLLILLIFGYDSIEHVKIQMF
jgi:hypothetical protein